MSLVVWPRRLTPARSIGSRLDHSPIDAGSTLGGVGRNAYLTAGGYWRMDLAGIVLRGDEAILAGRALQGLLLGGRAVLVRPCDGRQAPLQAGLDLGVEPDPEAAPFSDTLATESNPIVATAGAAALRAVSLTLAMVSGYRALVGGEPLTINHTNWGRRMYEIRKVTGGTAAAPVVSIWPPLRQAIGAATPVDFNRPGLMMQLDGPLTIDQTIPHRLHHARASFCELRRRPLESEL